MLPIAKQLCRALEVAHEAGVIHRDIKPHNMVVERVCMSHCYALMSRVSKVFMSTEAVFANGGLVAFAGSHAVCLAAQLCTIPVLVVVASIKFAESFPSDSAGSTLIKVDQHRSVEWREFLPPSDILPPECAMASDPFDCLNSSSSASSSDSSSDDAASPGTAAGAGRAARRAAAGARRRTRVGRLPPVQVWNPLNEYVPPSCISIFVTELHEITPALVQVFVEQLNEPKLATTANAAGLGYR